MPSAASRLVTSKIDPTDPYVARSARMKDSASSQTIVFGPGGSHDRSLKNSYNASRLCPK